MVVLPHERFQASTEESLDDVDWLPSGIEKIAEHIVAMVSMPKLPNNASEAEKADYRAQEARYVEITRKAILRLTNEISCADRIKTGRGTEGVQAFCDTVRHDLQPIDLNDVPIAVENVSNVIELPNRVSQPAIQAEIATA